MSADDGELKLSDVTKSYEGGRDVLRGVSLTVGAGETLAVAGPSGCGKSTLLNIIGSLDTPSSGSVTLGDIDIAALVGDALAAFRARQVGFIFQDHHLLPQLTALENVLLPSLAAGEGDATDRAERLLERVGVLEQAGSFPSRMSGGERQRVAIARAMINRPRLLLCDEPTGNLDEEAGNNVVAVFLELAGENNVTVVMVTHNLALAGHLSRCVEFAAGRIVERDAAPPRTEGQA